MVRPVSGVAASAASEATAAAPPTAVAPVTFRKMRRLTPPFGAWFIAPPCLIESMRHGSSRKTRADATQHGVTRCSIQGCRRRRPPSPLRCVASWRNSNLGPRGFSVLRTGNASRRRLLKAAAAGFSLPAPLRAAAPAPLRFGTTPVFLDDQLALLNAWQTYLQSVLQRPVQFVQRGSYREIVDLLLSDGIDVAWVCGFPYVVNEARMRLVAVPLYQGQPLYRSHLVVPANDTATRTVLDLRGRVFAYSDPQSNSGYLVPRVELIRAHEAPATFFRRAFYTFAHRKVVEAVQVGLAQAGLGRRLCVGHAAVTATRGDSRRTRSLAIGRAWLSADRGAPFAGDRRDRTARRCAGRHAAKRSRPDNPASTEHRRFYAWRSAALRQHSRARSAASRRARNEAAARSQLSRQAAAGDQRGDRADRAHRHRDIGDARLWRRAQRSGSQRAQPDRRARPIAARSSRCATTCGRRSKSSARRSRCAVPDNPLQAIVVLDTAGAYSSRPIRRAFRSPPTARSLPPTAGRLRK